MNIAGTYIAFFSPELVHWVALGAESRPNLADQKDAMWTFLAHPAFQFCLDACGAIT